MTTTLALSPKLRAVLEPRHRALEAYLLASAAGPAQAHSALGASGDYSGGSWRRRDAFVPRIRAGAADDQGPAEQYQSATE